MTDSVKEFLDDKELKAAAQNAVNRFAWKPYFKANAQIIRLSKITQMCMPVLSTITGALYLYTIVQHLPTVLAIIFAIVPFVIWEYFKNSIAVAAFDGYYSNRKDFPYMAAATLIFVVGSMFCSVKGAESIYQNVDNAKQEIEARYLAIADSVKKNQQQELSELKADKKAFESNNQVFINNKIGLKFNSKLSKQLISYEARIDSARSDHKAALKEINSKKKTAITEAAKDSGFNAAVFIVIAFIIDSLIVLSVWFPIFAQFQTAGEWQTITGRKVGMHIDFEELEKLLAMVRMQSMQDLQPIAASLQESAQIGFKATLKEVASESHKGTASSFKVPLKNKAKKDSDYWAKYPKLCKDLQQVNAGQLDVTRKSLASKYKVSVDTVYRVQKAILA